MVILDMPHFVRKSLTFLASALTFIRRVHDYFLPAVHTHDQLLTAFLLYFLLSAFKAFSPDESFVNSGSTLTADGFVVKLFG